MIPYVICGAVGLIVGAVIGIPFGIKYRIRIAEQELGSAEQEAIRIVSEAIKAAEAKKKEALVEAKDEIFRQKTDVEKELKERRGEVSRQERRLQHREELLDKKLTSIERKEELISEKVVTAEQRLEEAEKLKGAQFDMLERVSGYTAEQAKEHLLSILEDSLTHEKAVRITRMENRLKDESEQKAKEIISLAIQRCAAEHVAEATVSVVPLPNDEMKGRIIGREGRNIRSLENLTGVDLIIDDTPEAITLSSHDPVRREVARLALEKLIQDGRIHPTRIEEMVDRSRREIEMKIKQDGERAIIETGIGNMHPELIKLLGRMRYRSSYGQNVLHHSLEVAYIAGMIASEIGVDATLARRAGLLHDIGKSMTHEIDGSHVEIGVDIAKKYKEHNEVIHAIESHHGDVEPQTIIACIIQAADAISAARPGARRENLQNYMKRLEKLEEIANSFEGVEKCYAIQAGREIRIIVKPELINDDKMIITAREIVAKIENEMNYPGQIKVHLVRETRMIEFAK